MRIRIISACCKDCRQLYKYLIFIYNFLSSSHDMNQHELVGTIDTILSDLIRQDEQITTTSRSLRIPSMYHRPTGRSPSSLLNKQYMGRVVQS